MSPIEYQSLAKRTAGRFENINDALVNWALGIAGETAEVLDLFDAWSEGQHSPEGTLTKELGDVLWYTALMCEETNISLADLPKPNIVVVPSAAKLAIAGGKVADYIKKVVCHGHELDSAKLWKLTGMVYDLTKEISVNDQLEIGVVMHENIEKLKRRYPKGFSTEASQNRAEGST